MFIFNFYFHLIYFTDKIILDGINNAQPQRPKKEKREVTRRGSETSGLKRGLEQIKINGKNKNTLK